MRKLFVRALTIDEIEKLETAVKKSNNNTTMRRAQVILLSNEKKIAKEIAETSGYNPSNVNKIIHAFNDRGIQCIIPIKSTGRPSTIKDNQKNDVVILSKVSPRSLGYAFNSWTLFKLKAASEERNIFESVSHMSIKRILAKAGISHQRTKTWMQSEDPEFEVKKNG